MNANFNVEWNSRDLGLVAKCEKHVAAALWKAGGDAARAMRATSTREIRGRKKMKAGRLRRGLPLEFPRAKTIAALAWKMHVSGALVPVSAFPLRVTPKGISVAINVGERSFIPDAFVAVMKSGHKGVFRRHGRARLPIKEAFTTRVVDVFEDAGFIPLVQGRAAQVFDSAFARLLPLEIARAKIQAGRR